MNYCQTSSQLEFFVSDFVEKNERFLSPTVELEMDKVQGDKY